MNLGKFQFRNIFNNKICSTTDMESSTLIMSTTLHSTSQSKGRWFEAHPCLCIRVRQESSDQNNQTHRLHVIIKEGHKSGSR